MCSLFIRLCWLAFCWLGIHSIGTRIDTVHTIHTHTHWYVELLNITCISSIRYMCGVRCVQRPEASDLLLFYTTRASKPERTCTPSLHKSQGPWLNMDMSYFVLVLDKRQWLLLLLLLSLHTWVCAGACSSHTWKKNSFKRNIFSIIFFACSFSLSLSSVHVFSTIELSYFLSSDCLLRLFFDFISCVRVTFGIFFGIVVNLQHAKNPLSKSTKKHSRTDLINLCEFFGIQ